MSLGSVRPLQGWGAVGAHRGLLSLEEAWTLESPSSDPSSLPGEESEPMLRINSRAGKMIARQKLVARFAFVVQGKGYKYARKPNYDCNQNGAKSLT